MEKEQKRKLAQLVFDCFNTRDFSKVEPFVADDIIFNFPGAGDILGARKALFFMKMLLRKFPVLEFDISEIIVEGEKAVAVWTNSGKNTEGEEYSNSGMTLFHFKDGMISVISDYFKNTSFTED
ncbi:MAG: nuclear transport factor 2 family protein [Draconibacterium sp.]|nr:nuclear transport factor 2 family protein [Draconibacterium sp.]